MLDRTGQFRVFVELRQRGCYAVLSDPLTGQRKKHGEIRKAEVQVGRKITGPHAGDNHPFQSRLERQ